MRRLTPAPLTSQAFAPFGDVINTDTAAAVLPINYGHTTRYHDLAAVDVTAAGGRPGISLFRSTPMKMPITLTVMERHALASQAFIPLSGHPYIIAVAPPGDLDENAICVFQADGHTGVNYHRGTWHHFSLALQGVSDFLVIDSLRPDGEDPARNLTEVALRTPIEISLA